MAARSDNSVREVLSYPLPTVKLQVRGNIKALRLNDISLGCGWKEFDWLVELLTNIPYYTPHPMHGCQTLNGVGFSGFDGVGDL